MRINDLTRPRQSAQVFNRVEPTGYPCPELRPFDGRPSAMDAFNQPSRMGNWLVYRDGRRVHINAQEAR